MSRAVLLRASQAHPGFAAALIHRLSGLALAVFLPLHFLALGLALEEAAFAALIDWTDGAFVKMTEAALVTALSVHSAGGVRLLAVEFCGLTRAQSLWIALAFAVGVGTGLLFLMRVF